MAIEYNLLDRPWLPCIGRDGAPVGLGLRGALAQAHNLRELRGDTPLETASLHRLALAVLHRVYGPATYDGWHDLWRRGRFDPGPLDAYLDAWHRRFDLFDAQRPFYQASDDRVSPKPVNNLVQDLASGNRSTLFDHHTDRDGATLTAAKAARCLLAAQAFGLAGLSGLAEKFTDGPWARGAVFLVQGDSLFETLMLNMLRYPTEDAVLPHRSADLPAWEMQDPLQPPRTRPLGYLDYLTWHSRRVLLAGEQAAAGEVVRTMTIAPGLRLDADIPDPMKHYRRDPQRGLLAERFGEGRALWRDSAALFKLHVDAFHPPRVLAWLSELVAEGILDTARARRLAALGMANNQALVYFFREERMPLPLDYLVRDELVERLDEALRLAERTRDQLWGAARTLARLVLSPAADLSEGHDPAPEDIQALTGAWALERGFWVRLELPFRRLVEGLPLALGAAMDGWQAAVHRAAWAAFDQVAHGLEYGARGLKATVRARDQLAGGLTGLTLGPRALAE
ncbi:MAG TPA: type I-E CRISPR-associated protein Cse1/CasA [Anaerolineae bacterium]|nr:type I-E CRISPR-associated protein Cse1/CasA [Anaerolineae bacterium]